MTANVGRDTLDEAFRRVRDLDLSLQEQLRTLAETIRRERPEFSAAVDRLVARLRHYGAGEAAPKIGDSMPSFVLPDESAQKVSLEELLDRGPVAVTFHRGHWVGVPNGEMKRRPRCQLGMEPTSQRTQGHSDASTADGAPPGRQHRRHGPEKPTSRYRNRLS
jgi:hypothetical protein